MIKESDILKESGAFWVLKCSTVFDVMMNIGNHSISVASFGKDQLDIAETYFNYLVKREANK
jgi:hypothetical protein